MAEALAALFVRIPVTQARQLDARAHALGRTKQDLVSGLLAESLEGEPLGQGYVERSLEIPIEEVLTLDELAHFLKLDPEAIMARVNAGELPGRCFGDKWRFSQHAVLSWLGGSDSHQGLSAGFRPSAQRHSKDDRPSQ
ncbi:helix-turn-helix domain-containing protein [Ferrimicrobium sp.]|uniref:helix-turn-helix domain-containing protein n=1 Tax=Ferrimicrobium sp. TaxID=2926050 RepID=UPI002624A591|nr:helix-turn-helix domain-containing protein [Ferrimicrobium sp.]